METISVAQQIKMVKGMVDMLNEQHPITTTGIPSRKYNEDRQLVDFKVIPHPHFTAIQSVTKKFWWIHCTCYHSWNSIEFDDLSKAFKEIALESGFEVHFGFVYISGLKFHYDMSKQQKCIFIGKHVPTFIDGD